MSIRVLDGTAPAQARIEVRRLSSVVRLRIGPEVATSDLLLKSQSDVHGRCELKGLSPGRYQVRAAIDGRAPIYATVQISSLTARVELRMARAGGDHELRGRVVWDDGQAFDGIVELTTAVWFSTPDAWCGGASYIKTAKDGSFHIKGLAAGEYSLNVSQPGRFRHPDGWGLRVPMGGPCLLVADRGLYPHTLRIVDVRTGSPVPGAAATSLKWGWAIARGTTDSNGHVTVYAGEAVSVSKAGLESVRVAFGGPGTELKVALGLGGTLAGTVSGSGGAPATGIQVAAVREDPKTGDAQVRGATTDGQGRYSIDGLAEGPWLVVAAGAGQVSVDQTLWTEAGRKANVIEVPKGKAVAHDFGVRPAGRLEVHVTEAAGKPIRDCSVLLRPQQDGAYYGFWSQAPFADALSGRTDTKGVARFDTLVPGLAYWVETQVLHTSQRLLSNPVSASKTELVAVSVPARRVLEVMAVDEQSGAPMEGALVTVFESRSGIGTRWLTDKDGRAHIQIRTDQDLHVTCEKLGYFEPELVEVLEGKPTVVRLKASRSIKGRVLAPEGMGARLVHVRTDLGLPAGQASPGRSSWCEVPAGQTFELLGLKRGSYKVVAQVTWRGKKYRAEARAQTGATDVRLELYPHEADSGLRVRVLGPDGEPIPQASALLYVQGPSLDRAPQAGNVTEGLYRADLAEGTTRLWLEFHSARDVVGRALGFGPFSIGPIAPADIPEEVRLAPGLRLGGRIVDAGGNGVAGIRVSAHPMRRELKRRMHGYAGPAHAKAVTDQDGRYEFEGLGEIRYQVEVQEAEGFAAADPLQDVRPGGRTPDLAVRRAVRAKLRVVDDQDMPVRGARLVLWPNAKQGSQPGHRSARQACLTDAQGEISFADLHPERTYRMQVSAPDSRSELRQITLEHWVPGDQTLRFELALEISGKVRDRAGRPLPGIRVGRLTGPQRWFRVKTDAEGRYRFTDLRAGEYEIALRDSVMGPHERLAHRTAEAGARAVDFEIDARRMLRLRLIPTEISPQPITLAIAPPNLDSPSMPVSVAKHGISYVLDLNPAWEYALFSGPSPEGRCYYKTGVRTGGDVLEVKRSKGEVVQGRLELPKGARFSTLVGRARMGAFGALMEVSGEGTWILAGVPAGTVWNVEVTGVSRGRYYSARGEVTVGENDVPTLVLKEGRPGR